jgi:hypothetical protein
MEAGLILRIECTDIDQRDFVYLILDNSSNTPLSEDDFGLEQRDWFTALEDIEIAEYVGKKGNTTIEATWTLGGTDIEEDVQDILNCLMKCNVQDTFGIFKGDEGWVELWILKQETISRHESWNGESLEDLLYAESSEEDDDEEADVDNGEDYDEGEVDEEDNIFVVLDRIRAQTISSK